MKGSPRQPAERSARSLSGRRAKATWACRTLIAFATCPALLVVPSLSRSQAPDSGGYQLKLAFLYNFAKFVEWPPGAFPQSNAPVLVGIVGHDPFTIDMEEQVCGRSANGHPILLKRLRPGDALRGCHIIFISAAENKNLPAILANLKGASVLTVGETDTFATNGGVIRFFVENNTLHFEINPDVAAQTGLRISSRLLALAKIVRNAAADEKPSAESKSPRGRIQR